MQRFSAKIRLLFTYLKISVKLTIDCLTGCEMWMEKFDAKTDLYEMHIFIMKSS